MAAESPSTPTLDALATLDLLNVRLQRLEHAVLGNIDTTLDQENKQITSETPIHGDIPTRLAALESRLATLRRLDGISGTLVRTIDVLRHDFPDLFTDAAANADLSGRATQILAQASLYSATSSRLQTLRSLKIPSAAASGALYDVAPEAQQLKERIERSDLEVEELRERSERVIEWWVKSLGAADLTDDWTVRLMDVDRGVRREYRRRAEDI